MFFTVFIVGKPGACKTTAHGSILLECKKNGFGPQFESDRIRLENRVVADTVGGTLRPDRAIVGPHSILFDGTKPPGRKVFHVTDGLLLNEEHEEMMRIGTTHRNKDGVVIEWALGKDVHFPNAPDIPLLQSGESFARLIQGFPIVDHRTVVVLEVEAGFDTRVDRNKGRIDGMKPETIEQFFGDGCELAPYTGELQRRGIIHHRINNDTNNLDNLLGDLEVFHSTVLRPVLERCRQARSIEGGQSPGIEY